MKKWSQEYHTQNIPCPCTHWLTNELPGQPCVSVIKLDNETAGQFQWIASFTLFMPDCGISYQNWKCSNWNLCSDFGNTQIGNVQTENNKLGNVQTENNKLRNAQIGRMEWPFSAAISDAVMDICKYNQMRNTTYRVTVVVCQVGEHQHRLAHRCSFPHIHTHTPPSHQCQLFLFSNSV